MLRQDAQQPERRAGRHARGRQGRTRFKRVRKVERFATAAKEAVAQRRFEDAIEAFSGAIEAAALPGEKFSDPEVTAKGEPRAHVPLTALETLWFNTGTLCNLACASCYIESSPTNDALVYIAAKGELY